jgi:hypothetical protein
MNSLYTSSWAKNVAPNKDALWNHEFKEIVNEGTRGRAAHPAYAKLMGMQSVKNLKGTMTPRYFATKVLRQLEKEHPEEKIEDIIANITDDDITSIMNVAAQMSRKLQMKPEMTFSAAKAEKTAPINQRFEKGSNASDTLSKNISPEAQFKYEGEVGENTIYSSNHNGLRFRVTVKNGTGKPMNLHDIMNAHVVSLQVEDPNSQTTVEGPQTDAEMTTHRGEHKRSKLVADYPHEGGKGDEDWNEPDPEETGGKNVKHKEDEEDESESSLRMPNGAVVSTQKLQSLFAKIDRNMNDNDLYGDIDDAKVYDALRKGDVEGAADEICYSYTGRDGGEADTDGIFKDIVSSLNYMIRNSKPMGTHPEAEETREKNIKHNMTSEEAKGYINGSEEDNEEPVAKLSPQAQQREMYNQMMLKRREMVKYQRNHDLGY